MSSFSVLPLSIMILVVSALVVESKRPSCDDLPNGTTIDDTRLCCRYYVCINAVAWRKNCGRGYSYDLNSKSCLQASLVNCTDNYGFAMRPQLIAPEVDDVTPLPDDNSTVDFLICNPPIKGTGSRSVDSVLFTPLNCQSAAHEGLYLPDNMHCRHYYQCRGGVSMPLNCPPEQWFDRTESICRDSALVKSCPVNRN